MLKGWCWENLWEIDLGNDGTSMGNRKGKMMGHLYIGTASYVYIYIHTHIIYIYIYIYLGKFDHELTASEPWKS